jgi:hypothetical protein
VILFTINSGLEIVGQLPTGRVGDAYSYTLSVRGGVSPYTMAVTSTLPDGLTATDNGDGTLTIAGTPTVEFAGFVTVVARDGALRSVARPLALTVLPEIEAPVERLLEDDTPRLLESGDPRYLE